MKYSLHSILVLAVLLYTQTLVGAAPLAGRGYFARTHIASNSTSTASVSSTTLAKALQSTTTGFANATTTITKSKATASKTKAESTASTTIIKGSSPLQTALTPKITDWNSCQGFLSSSGINLFVNQIDLSFDVVINQVTVFEILIDNKGRARETRVRHAFPQPTNYYPEFDHRGKNNGKSTTKGSQTRTKSKASATSTTTKTVTTTKAAKSESTASSKTTATSSGSTTAATSTTPSTTSTSSSSSAATSSA